MILVDFSSIFHRMVYSSVKHSGAEIIGGVFVTEDYAPLLLSYIMEELFSIQTEHKAKYGELVLCFDDASKKYWRTDVYPGYKASRKASRDKSEVNFSEVFPYMNELITQLKLNLPWKSIDIASAEADDIILVLAREFNKTERILIHSPDKDFLQSQRDTNNVQQYSSLTRKWLVPETKSGSMDNWIREHCVFGDSSDGVPKIVDHTEFSEAFIKYLNENGVDEKFHNVYNFKYGEKVDDVVTELDLNIKLDLVSEFDIFKLNRKKEKTETKDIYKDMRFGPAALEKAIIACGTFDKFLDSHPLYREHYDRNFILVMEEGIPESIYTEIMTQYNTASVEYNYDEFTKYLNENGISGITMTLNTHFTNTVGLTADNCGW